MARTIAAAAARIWDEAHVAGTEHGFRNAQVSLAAPTGTIAFMMDCDTTGVEPCPALVMYKQLAGGGTLKQTMPHAATGLRTLGYTPTEIENACSHVTENGVLHDWTGFHKPEHAKVFDCAIPPYGPAISPEGHVRMLGAIQPFLSGGISKTVNCPADTTPETIGDLYLLAWKLGVKSVAIYRDTSKAIQAISGTADVHNVLDRAARLLEPPSELKAIRKRIQVGEVRGYALVSYIETKDGDRPIELFVTLARQGDALNGAYQAIGILVSTLLQAGVGVEDVVKRLKDQSFKPFGYTGVHGQGFCQIAKSVVDFLGRFLEHRFLPHHVADTKRLNASLMAEAVKQHETTTKGNGDETQLRVNTALGYISLANCPNCETPMKYQGGTCHECPSCFHKEGSCGG
jgi:ribonucleoside-diphosphate reductase alpha chain